MIAFLDRPAVASLRVGHLLGLAILALGCLYLLPKAFAPAWQATDFKYFWLAGEIWEGGASPYGPQYRARGEEVFTQGNVPQQWGYPPHFRFIAEPVAALGFDTAALIWRLACALAVAAGALLLTRAVSRHGALPAGTGLVAAGLAMTMQATAHSVAIGQSSPLAFLAFSIVIWAWLSVRHLPAIPALALLMIKPTYGIIPCMFLLTQWPWTRTLILAGLFTIALTGIAIIGTDPMAILTGITGAFGSYADNPINAAFSMNGARHLAWLAGLGEVSQLWFLGAGMLVAAALGLVVRRATDPRARLRAVAALAATLLLLAPLHTYDGYFALAVAIPALALGRIEALAGLALFVVTWRSANIAEAFGLFPAENLYFRGATLESLAALAVFALFAATAFRRAQSNHL